ncbi:hypothetical protein AB0M20_23305 [Actinoplanes sp. NPDC051633]|uniref:hypothetical protein n=1 Tax=Actinoplanes sp. NPDC051633 TaxID=3155670 RepID=UPI00342B18EA
MKTLKSVLVTSGAAAVAVLAFAGPAAACDHHDHNGSNNHHSGTYISQGSGDDRNGILTGDILSNNCSVLNVIALVDC